MKIEINNIKELKNICSNKEIEINVKLNNILNSTKSVEFIALCGDWIFTDYVTGETFNYQNDDDFKTNQPLFFKALENGLTDTE